MLVELYWLTSRKQFNSFISSIFYNVLVVAFKLYTITVEIVVSSTAQYFPHLYIFSSTFLLRFFYFFLRPGYC